jgi:hypothetical protein
VNVTLPFRALATITPSTTSWDARSCVTFALIVTVPLTVVLLAGAVIFTCAYERPVSEITRNTATPIANVNLPALLARPVLAIRMTRAPRGATNP